MDVGETGFAMHRSASDDGAPTLHLAGRLRLRDASALWEALGGELGGAGPGTGTVDLSRVESLDGASASVLLAFQGEALSRGGTLRLEGARPPVARLLDLYGCPTGYSCLQEPPAAESVFAHIGQATVAFGQRTLGILGFVGSMLVSLGAALRAPRSVHWRDLGRLMERAGADGLPIVLLINFLVGLIIALQSANQLARFGANPFVADLVGLSVLRELAPLMTAIVVAGRSGAAYAAELGTMRVSEEIDALHTLGLDPQRFLVFPRVLALGLCVPLLVVFADIVGCLGGLLVAVGKLDLTPVAYWNQLRGAVGLGDLCSGLLKSGVFAVTITLVACQRGLSARGGAQGVGASTTSSVVITLFLLVLLDAGFTFLFDLLGI